MKVQLKVLGGAHAGKCMALAGKRFVMGRGEGCNLRSNSEAVSRRHCEIRVTGAEVAVRDLGSRNGTFVNGQRIEGDHVLHCGDKLTVGPLQFELLISGVASASGQKPAPPVRQPEGGTGGKWNDDTVGQWLDEADAAERVHRLGEPDTRIFKFDETVASDEGKAARVKKKKAVTKKKSPGKMPPKKDNSKDSQEAAAQMLRRLFNRG